MATITLFANRINNLPEIIRDAKSSVNTFKGDLGSLITSALQVDGDICSLDDTISSLRSSTDTQEEKIDALENIADDIEDFIDEVVSIDEDAADAINQSKDDFYDEYYYLKPDCEKSGWEKFKDGLKAVGEWCKEHWKFIVTVVIVIAAIVCLFVPGVNAAIAGMVFGKIILGAAAGALMGAISGGLMGGIMSALTGGSFFEGFEEGAFSGAITGAIMGGIGGAGSLAGNVLGKSCAFVEKFTNIINITSKVSTGVSTAMDLYDTAALAVGLFAPDCDFVKFNQRLHESKLYNGIQFGAGAIAAFTGGMRQGMSEVTPACFVAGTMIATVTGLVAIESIKAGDRVISADPETLKISEKRVLETYVREIEQLVHVFVGGEEIITTVDHPFYVRNYGFMVASKLRKGDKLITSSGSELIIEDVRFEHTEEPVKVYNFQVEDFHTYHVGNNQIFVHNAKCKVKENGVIEITDWEGYPEGGPKPEGELRLLEGDDYNEARKAANSENARMHRNDPSLNGKQIHEVHPVKFSGSPTDHANKIPPPRCYALRMSGRGQQSVDWRYSLRRRC